MAACAGRRRSSAWSCTTGASPSGDAGPAAFDRVEELLDTLAVTGAHAGADEPQCQDGTVGEDLGGRASSQARRVPPGVPGGAPGW
jgi:hypothetical protein